MTDHFSTMPSPSIVTPVNQEKAVGELNEFLRGELSACETYRQALDKLTDFAQRQLLLDCLASHEARVSRIRQRITQQGGTPDTSSGTWGAFAKLVEGGAKLFGENAAISALEEGEDYGLKQYRDVDDLDVATRDVVQRDLLPAQLKTHSCLSGLKKSMN